MQIYNFGWLGLPIGILYILKKYYLHSGELWLLFYANILLLSIILDSWIMQITHLIIVTAMSIHVLSITKQTSGTMSQKKYNVFVRVMLHLEEQLSILVYIVAAWVLLRVYTDKSHYFGVGTEYQEGKIFMGVNETLSGWNCTQIEFIVIPCIWLIFNCISYFIGNLIITVQGDKDNLYKQFVLKYKVVPDIIFSAVVFLFNFYSYWKAQNIFQCCFFWEIGYPMKLAVYYGFSFSTLYFFHVKKGVFLVEGQQNTSDKAQNEDRKEMQMDYPK